MPLGYLFVFTLVRDYPPVYIVIPQSPLTRDENEKVTKGHRHARTCFGVTLLSRLYCLTITLGHRDTNPRAHVPTNPRTHPRTYPRTYLHHVSV